MHAVITGGAGFLGSHLTDRLLEDGWRVTVLDDLSRGYRANLTPKATLLVDDVRSSGWIDRVTGDVDVIWHLASPCAPVDYQARQVETLLINAAGTAVALELAARHRCRFVLASTSEVYGDPQEHPQPETYSGNVDPTGPRSCYDEGKRYAEALAFAVARERGVDVKVARIFNTYGPGMPDDGRVVIRFLLAAVRGEPIAVQGNGSHTRSFCYVDDAIEGLIRFAGSDLLICNVGGDDEVSMKFLAEHIVTLTGSPSEIKHVPAAASDPRVRCPDLSRLRSLGWRPTVPLWMGLSFTADWLRASDRHSDAR